MDEDPFIKLRLRKANVLFSVEHIMLFICCPKLKPELMVTPKYLPDIISDMSVKHIPKFKTNPTALWSDTTGTT